MEIRMRLAIALVVAATGCAAPPGEGVVHTATVQSTVAPKQTMDLTRDVVVRQVTIEAPRARVWEELHAVHRALGLDFVNGDVASGSATFEAANRIRTVAGKPASRYIDCGQGPAGARATILTSTMQAWARNPGVSSDPIPCASYGLLEREIGGMVMTRLQ
jgi:hypothetical protein